MWKWRRTNRVLQRLETKLETISTSGECYLIVSAFIPLRIFILSVQLLQIVNDNLNKYLLYKYLFNCYNSLC